MNLRGPKALYQLISERGHLPRPEPLDTNSSRALQQFRLAVLLDRSTAAIGATNMRTNQPRRIEAKSSCSTVVLTLAYGPSRTGLMTFSCKPALFRDTS
jgi:hypothetical protein